MTPSDWAKRPFENYADFSGRASRPEYWWFILAYFVTLMAVSIVEGKVGLSGMIFGAYGPITLLLALGVFIPCLAVGVRRLHDTDRSGWWMLISVVPIVGLALIYFLALPGTGGVNQYGSPPDTQPALQD